MATKYDQSSATRPVSIRSHTSAFQVHFKHTSSALEMSSVNPPNLIQHKVFYDPQPFHMFMDSDQHDVRYVSCLGEHWVEVHYKV